MVPTAWSDIDFTAWACSSWVNFFIFSLYVSSFLLSERNYSHTYVRMFKIRSDAFRTNYTQNCEFFLMPGFQLPAILVAFGFIFTRIPIEYRVTGNRDIRVWILSEPNDFFTAFFILGLKLLNNDIHDQLKTTKMNYHSNCFKCFHYN